MEDGRWWELSRYYHDFYDFQIALLAQFEDEAGNKGKPRTLPFMPGPVTHVTDAISNGRRQSLDEYIKQLLAMPPHISRCQLVRQLFAPRPGDFEIDPTVGDDRLSTGSQQSSGQDPSRTASRQSSRGQINTSSSMGPPLPTATTAATAATTQRQPYQQHTQGSVSQSSIGHQSRAELQSQAMNRQPSSITQTSGASQQHNPTPIKIKVFFQDDIIAIRVPSDISFQHLKEKLKERLKVVDDIMIQYKDEPSNTFAELVSDNDLDTAFQRNAKLALYVGFL